MTAMTADELPERLVAHLSSWVGGWPPGTPARVVGNPRNAAPGWDDSVHRVTGIIDPRGRAALGVPPAFVDVVRSAQARHGDDLRALLDEVPSLLDEPTSAVFSGTFRWTTTPAPLPDAGEWVAAGDAGVLDWLRPFGGHVLVARDGDGRVIAGVGIKRHDDFGREISVGTEPDARGTGLARRLVAQAARAVLADGFLPTYLHDPANTASAKVADAAGFPDLGWQVLGMFGAAPS
jgi:GNAT superfamily N-acetyltransferase